MNANGIDKPIWVTEAEFDGEQNVVSSLEGALNAGASKIFFTRFSFKEEYSMPKITGSYSEVYKNIAEKCL